MIERRRDVRRRCLLGSRIEFNNRNSTMDCVVRDQSTRGLKLVVDHSHAVPFEFDLVTADCGHRRRARIAWRRDNQLGIELLAS